MVARTHSHIFIAGNTKYVPRKFPFWFGAVWCTQELQTCTVHSVWRKAGVIVHVEESGCWLGATSVRNCWHCLVNHHDSNTVVQFLSKSICLGLYTPLPQCRLNIFLASEEPYTIISVPSLNAAKYLMHKIYSEQENKCTIGQYTVDSPVPVSYKTGAVHHDAAAPSAFSLYLTTPLWIISGISTASHGPSWGRWGRSATLDARNEPRQFQTVPSKITKYGITRMLSGQQTRCGRYTEFNVLIIIMLFLSYRK